MKSFFLFVTSLLLSTMMCAQSSAKISGYITDKTGKSISGVSVSVEYTSISTQSDKAGYYQLPEAPVGKQRVYFSFSGYESNTKQLTVVDGEEYELNIVLEENYFLLGEVTVRSVLSRPGAVWRLPDFHQTYITAGKKNEVVQVDGMNANITEKTGRQVFSKVPGTFVYDMDGSGNQINIATRGLDPHRSWEYNIRQNGIITNSDLYGYPASHYSPPLESIRKVEIIRGTSSLQYGAGFGGVINYVTKTPDTTAGFGFENISTVGSYGLLSNYSSAGGRTGKWTYQAYISNRKSDGYRENARSEYNAQLASISYAMSDKMKIKAEFGHMRYLYQIPGPLTDSMFKRNSRQSTRSRNYFNPDIYLPSLHFDWRISALTHLNVTASALLGSRNSVQFLGFANLQDTINHLTGEYANRQVDIDRFNSYTTEIRLLHHYRIGGFNSSVSTGIRLINNILHRKQIGRGTGGSEFDLSLSVPGFGRDLQMETRNIALFAENLIYINPALSISPGIRFENGSSQMRGTISYYDPGNVPQVIHHQFPLFGITAQYHFTEENKIYGGWAEAYRPVLFADLIPATSLDKVDKNLKDSKGYTAELGVNGTLAEIIRFDIGAFALRYNNRTGSVIETDESGNTFVVKTNIGESITKGLEIFIELDGKKIFGNNELFNWSLFTSTSFMHASYLNGMVLSSGENKSVKGNKLETVPNWISRNGFNLAFKQFSCTIQLSHVSESFSDALNTKEPNATGTTGIVPAYTITDINASYRINRNLVLKLGLNNCFDKQYFTKRPSGYPGPGVWSSDGRSLIGTLHFKL